MLSSANNNKGHKNTYTLNFLSSVMLSKLWRIE